MGQVNLTQVRSDLLSLREELNPPIYQSLFVAAIRINSYHPAAAVHLEKCVSLLKRVARKQIDVIAVPAAEKLIGQHYVLMNLYQMGVEHHNDEEMAQLELDVAEATGEFELICNLDQQLDLLTAEVVSLINNCKKG